MRGQLQGFAFGWLRGPNASGQEVCALVWVRHLVRTLRRGELRTRGPLSGTRPDYSGGRDGGPGQAWAGVGGAAGSDAAGQGAGRVPQKAGGPAWVHGAATAGSHVVREIDDQQSCDGHASADRK